MFTYQKSVVAKLAKGNTVGRNGSISSEPAQVLPAAMILSGHSSDLYKAALLFLVKKVKKKQHMPG